MDGPASGARVVEHDHLAFDHYRAGFAGADMGVMDGVAHVGLAGNEGSRNGCLDDRGLAGIELVTRVDRVLLGEHEVLAGAVRRVLEVAVAHNRRGLSGPDRTVQLDAPVFDL